MNLESIKNKGIYEIVEDRYIKDLNSQSYLLRHKKSGARVAILENDDNNKVFYIGFRTPPTDSRGVAHILEHSVLCGSKKYPSKDPFVELVKGSLNTFLNAMTFPDKTVYPVASCNDKDFKNLMDIYLDAVFHPNIYDEKKIFMQEGWHYELENADAPLKINGVVYSEMKGAFSSPDDVLAREIFNSLFPDTAYGVESGGDPKCIPDLTYEDFLDFHRRYYHPSNSYIYLYGDADMAERLDYLDKEYLSDYDTLEIQSHPGIQETFEAPVSITKEYAISDDEETEDNTFLSYNIMFPEKLTLEEALALNVIDYALVDAQGTPLRKALIDSQICSDVNSTYENGICQYYYSLVARNANPEDVDDFKNCVEETLAEVVKNGFDKNALLASINSNEFRYRESDFGTTPRGLILGLMSLDTWLYDDNKPFTCTECNEAYAFLRSQVDTDYFEKLLERLFINNNHKSVITLSPVRGLANKEEQELAEKLAKYKASLSNEEINQIVTNTAELLKYQETQDSQEVLDMIPKLKREELEKNPRELVTDEKDENGIHVLHHNVFTNGIVYSQLLFDMGQVPVQYIPYMSLLENLLCSVDTENYSYEQLGYEIDMKTGNMYPTHHIVTRIDSPGEYKLYFGFKGKCMLQNVSAMMELMKEIIFTTKFDDYKRIYETILEIKSKARARILQSGHSVAIGKINSALTGAGVASEYFGGLMYCDFIDELADNFENRKEELTAKLIEVRNFIFSKEKMVLDVTGDKDCYEAVMANIDCIRNSLYENTPALEGDKPAPVKEKVGLTSSSMVNYVAVGGNFLNKGFDYTGALRVLKTIMGYEYLWNEVRVKGGAYGCFSAYSRFGLCYFVSYRDPNLDKTIEIYKKAADFVRKFEADEKTMTKYIIGTMSELDTPLTPRLLGERSLMGWFAGLDYDYLVKERNEVLNATAEDIRKLADYIDAFMSDDNLCVVGNDKMINDAASLFDKVLPLVK